MPLDPALPDDPETLKGMIRELLVALHDKDRKLEGVQQRLDQLLRRLYGPKSERFRLDQPGLFDDLLGADPDPTPAADETSADESATPRRKKGHGRRRLPADLERKRQVHDLPEAAKVCPCCQQTRIRIGEETSEQLDYQPAKVFVWQHVRLKYACPSCLAKACAAAEPATAEPDAAAAASSEPIVVEPTSAAPGVATAAEAMSPPAPVAVAAVDPASLIVTAPKPAQPIDKGLPGPGLLAYVITSKYADRLPLHRQEAILARHGVELSRSTLCGWMAAAANLLTPLPSVRRNAARRAVGQPAPRRRPGAGRARKHRSQWESVAGP